MSIKYQDLTFTYIMNRAMARVSNTLDKREGSIIYDALAPACYELAEAYMALGTLIDYTFADTATGEFLIRRVAEIGVTPFAATKAVRVGEFNLPVAIASRFSLNDTTYTVTELIAGNNYKLECEQPGIIGNAYTGALIPLTYVTGLTTANLTTLLIPGQDAETDAELRVRYFETLVSQAFGGNVADYKTHTKALAGVGGCKVLAAWNGGGTVKLIITDSTNLVPSGAVLNSVQTAIDPTVSAGLGLGIAPIGHVVTVEAVSGLTVNLAFTCTFAVGYGWVDVSAYARTQIEAYLATLRGTWDSVSTLVVRLSQIEGSLLQVTGIVDVAGTTINGIANNLILTSNQIPLLGTVVNV